MNSLAIVPDSSFYICFLDDIKKPAHLIRIFKSKRLEFMIGPLIKREIKKSLNYPKIEPRIKSHVKIFTYYRYGEILRPVFSIEEMNKGEHEVVAVAYILNFLQVEFLAILDEEKMKNFIKSSFPQISAKITGTVGFIGLCCCDFKIFTKAEGISILYSIRSSKFRVDDKILDKTAAKIEAS